MKWFEPAPLETDLQSPFNTKQIINYINQHE